MAGQILGLTKLNWASTDSLRAELITTKHADDGMYNGRFEADVIVCVESYVGALDGPEGVKLEEPVLITESGPEVLTALPLDAADI